jgi:hypothetical protein
MLHLQHLLVQVRSENGTTFYLTVPISDPDPHGSALILVGWIRIQEGKKLPTKIEKMKIKVRSIGCSPVTWTFLIKA